MLERQTTDIDFVLASEAITFAKEFAESIRATCIVLEENPPTARVIVKKSARLSIDFTQFRAASLAEDLRLRDLTINAMAIALENGEKSPSDTAQQSDFRVIDPCGGMKDLKRGLLQFPSEQVVQADPVRLLRIYRFAAQLNFKISQDSIRLISKHRSLISHVAAERCRDELMKILNVKQAYPYLQQMATVGLLGAVIPSVKETPLSWEPFKTFEENPIPAVCHAYQAEINTYLQETLEAETNRWSLLKLTLLLEGNLSNMGKYLRLSRKAIQFMKCLISGGEHLKKNRFPLDAETDYPLS